MSAERIPALYRGAKRAPNRETWLNAVARLMEPQFRKANTAQVEAIP